MVYSANDIAHDTVSKLKISIFANTDSDMNIIVPYFEESRREENQRNRFFFLCRFSFIRNK